MAAAGETAKGLCKDLYYLCSGTVTGLWMAEDMIGEKQDDESCDKMWTTADGTNHRCALEKGHSELHTCIDCGLSMDAPAALSIGPVARDVLRKLVEVSKGFPNHRGALCYPSGAGKALLWDDIHALRAEMEKQ